MDSQEGLRKERVATKRHRPSSGSEGATQLMMRRCQQCRRAGAVRSSTVDLCEDCNTAITEEVHERVRTIQETLRKSKMEVSVGAKLRHWDLILAQTEALLKYEEREILTTCPPPSTLLEDFRTMRDTVLGKGEAQKDARAVSHVVTL